MAKTTPEQLIGTKSERLFGVQRATINKESRTVEVAFASPTPVRRWWGDEVLEISAQAIRGTRLDDGAAVLVDHRSSDHVGVVEGWRIEGDRARATLRFGRSARAQEVFDDIVDGIRKHISVGYSIHNVVLQQRGDEGDTYLVTDWEPYEISVVGVPADPGVGVGRSAENATEGGAPPQPNNATTPPAGQAPGASTGERAMPENTTATTVPAAAAPAAPAVPASSDKFDILDLGVRYGHADFAREAIASGTSLDEFQRALLDRIGKSKPVTSDRSVGMEPKEAKRYSFMRLLRALAHPDSRKFRDEAGLEFEAHEAMMGRGFKPRQGILVPDDVLQDRAWSPFNTGTSGTDTGDTGGKVVPNTLMAGSYIDMLRNRAVMMRLGRTMTGLVGTFDIPKKLTGGSAAWIGEDAAAPKTGMTVGQIQLAPHTCAAENQITRRLLMQSTPDAEALVRQDIVEAMALAIDLAAIYGNPSEDLNSPRGILFQSGINTKDFAGIEPTYAELVDMETRIAADNADVASMLYLVNATTRGALKTTEKFSGTNGAPVWEPGNTVNGYRTEVTNQLTTGDVLFGNFADLIIAMWGGFELFADPYSESSKGRIKLVTFQDVDFAVRRAESFCYGVKPAPEPDPE